MKTCLTEGVGHFETKIEQIRQFFFYFAIIPHHPQQLHLLSFKLASTVGVDLVQLFHHCSAVKRERSGSLVECLT